MLQALMSRRKFKMGTLVAVVTILGGISIYLGFYLQRSVPDLSDFGAEILQKPITIGDFSLQDHNSNEFNLQRMKGKWTFLYFGYLTCSDLCPTTVSAMSDTYEVLDKSGLGVDDLQFAFVSVDPHRDSLNDLKEYVSYFNPKFLGVTGDRAELDKITLYVGAKYGYEDSRTHKLVADVKELSDDENYTVRHFGDLFVFDPDAKLVAYIYPYHNKKNLVASYKKIRSYF